MGYRRDGCAAPEGVLSGWQVQSGRMTDLADETPTLPETSNRSRFMVLRRYVFQNPHLNSYFAHRCAG
jgi:hypothetical protein